MYQGSPKLRDQVPIVTLTAKGFTPGKAFLYLCLKTSYKCFISVSRQFLHAGLQIFHHTNSGGNREYMNEIYKWGSKLTEISLIKLHQTVKSDHNTFSPSRDAPWGDNACQVLWSSYLLSARDGPEKGSLKSQNKTKIGERGQPAVRFDFCQFFYQRLIGRLISSKNKSFRQRTDLQWRYNGPGQTR